LRLIRFSAISLRLTVGPNIEYVLVRTFNPYTHLPVHVVLAKALLSKLFKPEGENGDFDTYNAEQKLLPWKKPWAKWNQAKI